MSQASQNMYKTIKESYEPDWPGYTDTTATIEVGLSQKFHGENLCSECLQNRITFNYAAYDIQPICKYIPQFNNDVISHAIDLQSNFLHF